MRAESFVFRVMSHIERDIIETKLGLLWCMAANPNMFMAQATRISLINMHARCILFVSASICGEINVVFSGNLILGCT